MPATTSPTAESYEILKIIIQATGYVIGWIIVVIGWNVSNRQGRGRDERKDLRDRVSDIAKMLRDVEADVVAYVTNASGGDSFWTVHFGVQRVNSSVVMCPAFDTDSINAALINYRQSITGQAVGGPTSKPKSQVERDNDLRRVSKAGSTLIRALEQRFAELYASTESKRSEAKK